MDLTLLVCAYDMQRELSRTIYTLSPKYQRNLDGLDYEIIVVDNGSPNAVDEGQLQAIVANLRVIRVFPAKQSPAEAINVAIQSARGNMVGLFIDGARMASPGLLGLAYKAFISDNSKVIGTLGFHLGPDVQMRSVTAGYTQAVEDKLLAKMPWQENGYLLFDISVLAGSSREGWFGCMAESNAIFLSRSLWDDLGGLDERFASPGGGFVNLDFWDRAVKASDYHPWILLGEGTFHQIHGGAATNAKQDDRKSMSSEYTDIHGKVFSVPRYQAHFIGELSQTLALRFAGKSSLPSRKTYSIEDRRFEVGIPSDLLDSIQAATLKMRYKGLRLAKNPFDLVLYLRLLEKLAPQTIVEIGTSEGGSAIWFRDQCKAIGFETDILSIDLSPPSFHAEGISFIKGDSNRPDETFPYSRFVLAPHPWLIIEDSAHTYGSVSAVLEYFDKYLETGDYIVVEDGVVADLRDENYRKYADGPNSAVADFLRSRANKYHIDSEICDFFGANVTYCPNGWLVKL